jgi:hypothetical protein
MGTSRYISLQKEYMQLISNFKSDNKEVGPIALDILQIYAHNESLSAYQVFAKLKSTHLQMAYKNVHKRIQRLKILSLIEEKQRDKAEHGAKYYRLTEYGIYQLFLKRVHAVSFDQLYIEKFKKLQIHDKALFKYYNDNALFRTFLYPYLDKNTLLNLDDLLVITDIFGYLHDCCNVIEKILHSELAEIPAHGNIYSWNKASDVDKKRLLLSLKEIFGLEDINISNTTIKKMNNNNTLQISHPQFCILIELDLKRKKAIAKFDKGKRKYEYDIEELGSDIFIESTQPGKYFLIELEFQGTRLIEILIYNLISRLGRLNGEYISKFKALSADDKFMELVDDMHINFKQGYNKIMNLRNSPTTN